MTGNLCVPPRAIDTGCRAHLRLRGQVEGTVAVDRSHRRELRDRDNLSPRRSNRDHRQHMITGAANNTEPVQVCEVGISRQMIIDNHRIDAAVVS